MENKKLKNDFQRISKKNEEIQGRLQELDRKAHLERMEKKLEDLEQKKEIGNLSWKEKIMMEIYEDQIKKAKKEL